MLGFNHSALCSPESAAPQQPAAASVEAERSPPGQDWQGITDSLLEALSADPNSFGDFAGTYRQAAPASTPAS